MKSAGWTPTSLAESKIIAFIPSTNLGNAKIFFEAKLGLTLSNSDEIALEFSINEAKLRVILVTELTPASYTIFGWEVIDIEVTVKELMSHKIEFEKYYGFSQSDLGVCTFPGGSKVAWFKDLDGNILSITQSK